MAKSAAPPLAPPITYLLVPDEDGTAEGLDVADGIVVTVATEVLDGLEDEEVDVDFDDEKVLDGKKAAAASDSEGNEAASRSVFAHTDPKKHGSVLQHPKKANGLEDVHL